MGVEDREERVYEALLDRCRSMEKSQAKLREQFHELLQNKRDEDTHKNLLSCFFFSTSIYESIMKCMGHALHIYKPSSREIIYWNHTAENLYGWKDYEIIGQRFDEFLISEEYYASLQKIMERLMRGVPWSGQFPLKKRSGEVFMAMVTKTPLYEDGELVGVITVSSDAAVFNFIHSENLRTCQFGVYGQPEVQRLNSKRIQWPPRPLIASSVSNLASKILQRRHADDTISRNTSADADDEKLEQCSIYAARFLAKLQIGGSRKLRKDNGSIKSNCTNENSGSSEVNNDHDLSGDFLAFTPQRCVANGENKEVNLHKLNSLFDMKKADTKVCAHKTSSVFKDSSVKRFSMERDGSLGSPISQDPLLRFHCQFDYPKSLEPEATSKVIEDVVQKQQEGLQLPSSGESTGSHESSSSKWDESNTVRCEIRWEDLELREEIGQGSYAVVHHGIWNGSDVAVKVYFGNGYAQETLQDYRKEIDIMKRLRHPNVLLFMGAVYSPERLAIMTELLPRGSLFKILHNNNQTLDIRRRLRMALDVARGMNYLHHRNPPIVHRDLKSSNLLVDKNWTVKVGDFGLSKLKNATLLTTKSGRGTPQWMAPEVLRNEPSNEKSDVFSFGVILWELMTQSIPWKTLNFLQVVGVVGFMDRRLDMPEGLDPDAASIIQECWRSDSDKRPSFQELIQRMMFLLNKVTAGSIRRI
ncbi:PREDICTED: dual specificity protein kinase shkB-like isoform X2 [Lupinus angustifolius]|uniref:dual specificity protein kinase shkB-like isoform X2 n=1 Tax=Lupinus angustifolius TaxID=3871 RepID=UPI00092F6F25|nr:PREDICTED: dual specificity protein kinase shkB-like isoform X2 [Lupinus angustifolius]